MTSSSPASTPKRKRDPDAAISSASDFSFDLSHTVTSDDGGGSPRSKVALRFRGLGLGSGGGVLDDDGQHDKHDGTTDATPKRQKWDRRMLDAGQNDDPDHTRHLARAPDPKPQVGFKTQSAPAADDPFKPPLPSLPSPDETERSNVKSPPRKRAGTPPLRFRLPPTGPDKVDTGQDQDGQGSEDDDGVVDPVRAALTWHEDEITVYDPEDADDDGIGVNGLGFKPTPALAHARAMRRRQQMADYRKREEGEARSLRTRRRRGEEALSARPKKKSPGRRVHFLKPERRHTVVLTP